MDHPTPGEAVMTGALDPEARGLLYGLVKEKPARAYPLFAARLHIA
jgi:hypothetical protein